MAYPCLPPANPLWSWHLLRLTSYLDNYGDKRPTRPMGHAHYGRRKKYFLVVDWGRGFGGVDTRKCFLKQFLYGKKLIGKT